MQTIGEKIVKTAFTFSARSILKKKIPKVSSWKIWISTKKKEKKKNELKGWERLTFMSWTSKIRGQFPKEALQFSVSGAA